MTWLGLIALPLCGASEERVPHGRALEVGAVQDCIVVGSQPEAALTMRDYKVRSSSPSSAQSRDGHGITQMRGQGVKFRLLPSGLFGREYLTAPTISLTPRPRTIRLRIIWAVTTRRAAWLAGEMSPKPTVAKTVTVK
jgi:hypothetical protein